MERWIPTYFKEFRCLAGACPDSCCKEWAVDVDDASAARYRALPGALGDRLRQVLRDTEDGVVMAVEDGRCPMWRRDGLCRIQAELGHAALCQVCRQFPRLRHDYGDFEEWGLELSCPEAARLILTAPDAAFIKEETAADAGVPDYDKTAMAVLRRTRAEILDFLCRQDYTVPQALSILLLFGYEVQAELDGGEEAVLEPERALADGIKFAGKGDKKGLFAFFQNLEILTRRWEQLLERGAAPACWQETHRALARYMVSRYWLQAISDFDLISRIKLTVVSCLVVSAMEGDPIETAQLFSKEIENDPDNVEAILDGAYTAPAMTDTALLGALFE